MKDSQFCFLMAAISLAPLIDKWAMLGAGCVWSAFAVIHLVLERKR